MPHLLKILASDALSPKFLHHRQRRRIRFSQQGSQNLMRRFTLIQRRNQRLNDADRPVIRANIAPRLEIMRFGNVPVAVFAGLIVVEALLDAQRDFADRLIEFEIGWSHEDRVGP